MVSLLQYVATAIAFTIGKPFRTPVYANYLFMTFVSVITALSYYVILWPNELVKEFLSVSVKLIVVYSLITKTSRRSLNISSG
jgi:hypothetical protein